MSTADAGTSAGEGPIADEYDVILDALDDAIEEAREKVESGRVYDADNEAIRIKWIRALAYTCNVRRQVQNDATLAELGERVEDLEDATGAAP